MSEHGSYGQFCPVAMAAEIFCSRWTPLILREMFCGTRRFNDMRRGVPRMSPTLFSKRLVEMREAGIIEEVSTKQGGKEYQLTLAGEDLKPIVMAMGFWAQRWVEVQGLAQKSRSLAADVGHAALARPQTAAEKALQHRLLFSGGRKGPAKILAGGRP